MIRTLRDIPSQATVMVDANVVIYALFPQASQHLNCVDFLERGARDEVRLHVTVSIAADVIHRAMVLEAAAQGIAKVSSEVVTYLKQHPTAVQRLTRYKTILRDLTQAHISILQATYRDLHASKQYRDNYGLLTSDSLILAVMHREGIHYLATNDPDFERVPAIAVRQPG
jgi:predicted nucleic acid-binding protein